MADPITPERLRAAARRGDRKEIACLLQRLDPNSSWTNELSEKEGIQPASLDDAVSVLWCHIWDLEASRNLCYSIADEIDSGHQF